MQIPSTKSMCVGSAFLLRHITTGTSGYLLAKVTNYSTGCKISPIQAVIRFVALPILRSILSRILQQDSENKYFKNEIIFSPSSVIV